MNGIISGTVITIGGTTFVSPDIPQVNTMRAGLDPAPVLSDRPCPSMRNFHGKLIRKVRDRLTDAIYEDALSAALAMGVQKTEMYKRIKRGDRFEYVDSPC